MILQHNTDRESDMLSVLYVDDESNLLELTKLFLEFNGEFSSGY